MWLPISEALIIFAAVAYFKGPIPNQAPDPVSPPKAVAEQAISGAALDHKQAVDQQVAKIKQMGSCAMEDFANCVTKIAKQDVPAPEPAPELINGTMVPSAVTCTPVPTPI